MHRDFAQRRLVMSKRLNLATDVEDQSLNAQMSECSRQSFFFFLCAQRLD